VYAVIHVFKLISKNPWIKLYLDPEQLGLGGGLVFTGETWSIVQGVGHDQKS
jgi:hypothetical protein